MKDNAAFAAIVLAMLIAVASTWAFHWIEASHATAQVASSAKPPPAPEVRYLEPITVFGYRELPEQSPAALAGTGPRELATAPIANSGSQAR